MKRTLLTTVLVFALTASAKADMSFTGGGGSGGGSFTLPNNASSSVVPQVFIDITPGSGKTYSVPAGITKLEFCYGGGGGGGGAATSGGAAAVSGGSGASGNVVCGIAFGAALGTAVTYTVGAQGTAGTCSATPTAAGNGGASNLSFGGAALPNAAGGGAGGTAGAGTEGSAGSVGAALSASSFKGNVLNAFVTANSFTNGEGGNAGTGDTFAAPGYLGGGVGGLPYGETAGGACDASIVATPGSPGFVKFIAYFN